MRFRKIILLSGLVCLFFQLAAQKPNAYKHPRILILLDGSSSMIQPWTDGETRFKTASHIITELIDSVYSFNHEVEFSLRVYGHQHGVSARNCFDTKQEVVFSKDNRMQIALRLENLHPQGVSPIAYSLQKAAENDLAAENEYSYSLILITDGGESCEGDICAVVSKLLEKKIQFKPYIISLVDYEPLKKQYECLGKYLQVATAADIPVAIGTIAENYRKAFAIPVVKTKKVIDFSTIPSPSVLKVSVPNVSIPKKETNEPAPVKENIAPVVTPKPDTIKETAVIISPNSRMKVVNERPKETITLLTRKRLSSFLNWAFIPGKIPLRAVPKFVFKPAPEDFAQVPKIITNTQVSRSQPLLKTPIPFSVQNEVAGKTTIQVFFTNGKGKFYKTTPRMVLTDPKTKKEVSKFFRTIDPVGNPDLLDIPFGTYDLSFENKLGLVVNNVVIKENNNNKVFITISTGNLKFEYEGNLDRPVKEYNATVKRLFDNSPTVSQRCDQTIPYEPGNYHIEIIDVLPIIQRNVDILGFEEQIAIRVDEPGFVQFTNDEAIGKVGLFYPLGDAYILFHSMQIKGNPEAQKLALQPGIYEAHYRRIPTSPQETIVKFKVKSNEITPVEL